MRLTLRAMLAYMDGLLEPEDAQDIAKKIDESEYATALMHRVRDVMRRLRLAAPRVTDRGPGLDPNTVAEYLDNTLPSDQVQDFEKVCLDSDMHLAEVGSCHQILAAVLGEAAEIDPESRQRMYDIPRLAAALSDEVSAAAPPPLPEARAAQAAGTDGDDRAAAKRKPSVPDYLREPASGRRWLWAAAAVLLIAGFTMMVLTALGQFKSGTFLGDLLPGDWRQVAEAPSGDPTRPEASRPDLGSAAPAEVPGTIAQPPGIAADPLMPGDESGLPEGEPAPMPPGMEGDLEPGAAPPGPGESGDEAPIPPPIDVARVPGEALPPPPIPDEPEMPGAVPPEAPDAPEGVVPGEAVPPGTATEQPSVGRLLSAGQVLLRFDHEVGGWQRVAAKGVLASNNRLLALPAFRPEIALGTGVAAQLTGGTHFVLLAENQGLPAGLSIDFGQVLVMPLVEGGARVRLVAGNVSGMLVMAPVDSLAAIEVVPVLPPGRNPETEPRQLLVRIYSARGEVVWDSPGLNPVRLTAPAVLSLPADGTTPPERLEILPAWIARDEISPLDARAAATLEGALVADRPAGLGLMELAQHRQREVRWLAVRSLAYLGQMTPLAAALADEPLKNEWPDYIAQLRQAVVRDAGGAVAVRQALEKLYGPSASDMYRMLWGYTDDDLAQGEAARLVGMLESESLPIRVLSFWNLREITGLGLFYRPELSAANRQLSIQRWKQRLAAGEVRLREPGAPPPPPEIAPPEAESNGS